MIMYDLNIRKITNVYFRNGNSWSRDKFATRQREAVVFFVEGEIEYYFSDKTIRVKSGDLLFLPGDVPYSGKRISERAAYYVVDFVCDTPDEFSRLMAPLYVNAENFDSTYARFQKIFNLWNKQPVDINFKTKSFVYSVISEAFKDKGVKKTTSVEEMQEYIIKNIGNSELKVGVLCDRFFISESQLRRNFIKSTGFAPNEYIMNLRINKAKNELVYTKKTIKQIAVECGFSTPYYFSGCFTKQTKLSPTEYRKKYYSI